MISDITFIYIISIVPSRNFSSTLDFPHFTCHSSWVRLLTDIIFRMRNSVYDNILHNAARSQRGLC